MALWDPEDKTAHKTAIAAGRKLTGYHIPEQYQMSGRMGDSLYESDFKVSTKDIGKYPILKELIGENNRISI